LPHTPSPLALQGFLQTVAGAGEHEDVAMVNQAVNHSSGEFIVAEHRVPLGEFQIGCDDEALLLVAVGYHLKQQLAGFLVQRDEPNLVQDQ